MSDRAFIQEELVKGRACGKAIVIGEHAVVYGAMAVAIPLIDIFADFSIKKAASQTKIFLDKKPVDHEFTALVNEAFSLLGSERLNVSVYASTTIPISAGLGSSAALCIGLLRGLASLLKKKVSSQELARLGNIMEKTFHGTPSGLDTTVVSFERVISFVREKEPEILNLVPCQPDQDKGDWRFILIDSGLRSKTKDMIETARPYFQGSLAEKRITRFDDLAKVVARGLVNKDVLVVAGAMNEASCLLQEAGLVPVKVDELCTFLKKNGALAAKITGAGGGGFIIAVFSGDYSDCLAKLDLFDQPRKIIKANFRINE